MHRSFKIPITLLLVIVTVLAAGEIASGTHALFVLFVAGALLCIGVTYNLLGGLGSISGIAFAGFALCTIVISQFAKVVLWEAADKTLQSAQLTIEVYFVFYCCLLIGAFVFRNLRIRGPKPSEPRTVAQADQQFGITLSIGAIATFVYEVFETSTSASDHSSTAHSLGLAFSAFLLLSLVLAVHARIRASQGAHSFSLRALIPWSITVFFGSIETTRSRIILPTVLYIFVCWVSGFKFHRKHYAALGIGAVIFVLLISPFEIYVRGPMREFDFQDRIYELYGMAVTMPAWSAVKLASKGGVDSGSIEDYYERPGTSLLSRVSVIQADSNMIGACSSGFHYGFAALKMDFLRAVPRIIAPDKPGTDGASYTGRVTGMNADDVENGEFLITTIGDSYGAFGWPGVIVVALIVVPLVFAVYESLFDMTKPWGALAAAMFCFVFSEADMGKLMGLAVRAPIVVLLLSHCAGALTGLIPVHGDKRGSQIRDTHADAVGLQG